jgi:hypothetical protein
MGGPGPRATWVGKRGRGTRLDDLLAENYRAGISRKSKLPSRSPNQDAAANVRLRRDVEWVMMLLSSLCQQRPIPAQVSELDRQIEYVYSEKDEFIVAAPRPPRATDGHCSHPIFIN